MNKFRARCGRRREFPSVADVLAYEAGFESYRLDEPCPEYFNAMQTGWLDAEAEELDRIEALADAPRHIQGAQA